MPGQDLSSVVLAPGEAIVVGFEWTPTVTGHRCLLAAVRTEQDPGLLQLTPSGEIDFSQLNSIDSAVVPFDSNIGQLNLEVASAAGSSSFLIGNPFAKAKEISYRVTCDTSAISVSPDTIEVDFAVEYHAYLENAWSGVIGATISREGDELLVRAHQCGLRLPAVPFEAATEMPARMDIRLPAGAIGMVRADLTASIGGQPIGGMSVTETGVEIIPQ
jgi:hypothetical protein